MQKRTTKKTDLASTGVLFESVRKQIRVRAAKERLTIGLDLGDKHSSYCILTEGGEILFESALPTTEAGLGQVFEGMAQCRVAMEAGTHSPWVSRKLKQMGHEVVVANTRELAYITRSARKNDRVDARKLARLARVDVALLSPIRHRSEAAQLDLAVLRARDLAVRVRNRLLSSVRAMVKSAGTRLKACSPATAGVGLVEGMSEEIRRFAVPLLKAVEVLQEQIEAFDRTIAAMEERYPVAQQLQQVYGVGRIISLTFVLTIDDPARFRHSRDVGPYLGLCRKERDSGESQPELGINKQGDNLMRWLLVQAAHTILRRGGRDSDLRRWGWAMLEQGSQKAGKRGQRRSRKKLVVVAVGRRLAVLLHKLWVTGAVYDPLYNARQAQAAAKAATKKARVAA